MNTLRCLAIPIAILACALVALAAGCTSSESKPAGLDALPEEVREALKDAQGITLYSLDPTHQVEPDLDIFHRWRGLGEIEIEDATTIKRIADALAQGAEENEDRKSDCFNPRHGLRVMHKGDAVDLVICFECSQVEVYVNESRRSGFLTSDSPQAIFDEILTTHNVPLAKKVR